MAARFVKGSPSCTVDSSGSVKYQTGCNEIHHEPALVLPRITARPTLARKATTAYSQQARCIEGPGNRRAHAYKQIPPLVKRSVLRVRNSFTDLNLRLEHVLVLTSEHIQSRTSPIWRPRISPGRWSCPCRHSAPRSIAPPSAPPNVVRSTDRIIRACISRSTSRTTVQRSTLNG